MEDGGGEVLKDNGRMPFIQPFHAYLWSPQALCQEIAGSALGSGLWSAGSWEMDETVYRGLWGFGRKFGRHTLLPSPPFLPSLWGRLWDRAPGLPLPTF